MLKTNLTKIKGMIILLNFYCYLASNLTQILFPFAFLISLFLLGKEHLLYISVQVNVSHLIATLRFTFGKIDFSAIPCPSRRKEGPKLTDYFSTFLT